MKDLNQRICDEDRYIRRPCEEAIMMAVGLAGVIPWVVCVEGWEFP